MAGVLIYLFLRGSFRDDSKARKIAFTSFIISLVAVLLSTFISLGLLTFKAEMKYSVDDNNAIVDAAGGDWLAI